jgi:hypothetical protein
VIDLFGGMTPQQLAAQVYGAAPAMNPAPLLQALDKWELQKQQNLLAGNGSPMSFELAKGDQGWQANLDKWMAPQQGGGQPGIGQLLAGAKMMAGSQPQWQPPPTPFVDASGAVGGAQPAKLAFQPVPGPTQKAPSLGELLSRTRYG